MKNTSSGQDEETELYPIYKRYITMLAVSSLVVLPICAGIGYFVYIKTPLEPKLAFAIPFGFLFVYVAGMLLHLMFLKCPHCGRHSLYRNHEPADVTSGKFVYRQFFVVCRKCGFSQDTDLGLKSNIFIKSIPFKIKPEDEEE